MTEEGLRLDRFLSTKGPLPARKAVKVTLQLLGQFPTDGSLIYPARIQIRVDSSIGLLPRPPESLPAILEHPAYASPEEVRGGAPDVRSSLYSLGCTLFEMLTGSPPFAATDSKVILKSHLEAAVPDVRAAASDTPDGVAAILTDLLAKDPELRIQNAEELNRRLRQALAATTPTAPSSKPAPQPQVEQQPRPRGPAPATARKSPTPSRPSRSRSGRPDRTAPAATRRSGGGRTRSREDSPDDAAGRSRRGGRPQKRGERGSRRSGGTSRRRPPRERDLDYDEYEDAPRYGRRRQRRPFTVAGAVLGTLIGVVMVGVMAGQKAEQPERDKLAADKYFKKTQAEALVLRKKRLSAAQEEKRLTAKAQLEQTRKLEEAGIRRDYLIQALNKECDSPAGVELANELLRIDQAVEEARTSQVQEEFAAHQKRVDALYEEGKLGDAIELMMQAQRKFERTRGDEIDEFVTRVSDELTEKWDEDVERVRDLARDGEPDKAIKVLELARKYGDHAIRKAAEEMIQSIRAQSSIASEEDDEDFEDDFDEDDEDMSEDEDEDEDEDFDDEDDEDEDDFDDDEDMSDDEDEDDDQDMSDDEDEDEDEDDDDDDDDFDDDDFDEEDDEEDFDEDFDD